MLRKTLSAALILIVALSTFSLVAQASIVVAMRILWHWSFIETTPITEAGPFVLDEPDTIHELTVDLIVPENDFHGFTIAASGVTLDLRGHTITGLEGYLGIVCDGQTGITVANGIIEDFDIGIVACDSDIEIKNVEILGIFKVLHTPPNGLLSTLVRHLINEYS